MGWHINLVKNTVTINKKIAEEIVKVGPQFLDLTGYYDLKTYECTAKGNEPDLIGQVIDEKNQLRFNSDHMEHMDFLETEDEVVDILRKHKVKGDVVFCSHDGDNKGQAWCHRFDGNGGYELLRSTTRKMDFKKKKKRA